MERTPNRCAKGADSHQVIGAHWQAVYASGGFGHSAISVDDAEFHIFEPARGEVWNMKHVKPTTPIKFLATNRGLMKCTLPDFEPQNYKGLKQNCGRRSKHTIKGKKLEN